MFFGKKKTAAQPEDPNAPVKILGSGCSSCNALEHSVREALERMGKDVAVSHVKDFAEIASYGVMQTPALVVDGKVLSYGKVLRTEEVISLLRQVWGD